jgi:hypothetical protein
VERPGAVYLSGAQVETVVLEGVAAASCVGRVTIVTSVLKSGEEQCPHVRSLLGNQTRQRLNRNAQDHPLREYAAAQQCAIN